MSQNGSVRSINISNGGVPKSPRPSARITRSGVEGDRQRDLRFHGGAERAVSLYSFDLIEQLQAEGHPIAPGTTGENLTIAGINWSNIRPGVVLEIGSVRLQVTRAASPCKNIAGSFVNHEISRISDKLHPGWSRFYCRVLHEGVVNTGDRVIVCGEGGDA